MKSNNESFQMSRKFGYATSLSFLSTIALIMNKATMNEWIEINKYLFTSYIMSNVTQKTLSK